MRNNGTIYDGLNEKRNKYNQIKNDNESGHVKQSKALHDSSVEFQSFLQNNNIQGAKVFLHELNKGLSIDIGNSKTVVLMDATGSMSHLLQNAKNTVKVMFSRVCAVLSKKGVSSECFQLQYCVYRNYSSNEDKILQVSPWTNKPDILERFMENVRPEGGQGNEAIEVGLWHINKISQNDKISQVILIGDCPPNTIDNIAEKRGARSSYWNSSKFSSVEYYERELAKIISKQIPINAFYVDNCAKVKFEEIARLTKGQSGFLDINSSSGADRLTDLVSTEVLRKSAGEDAVKLYREMYPRSYT
ncbi:unnamed protein product [Blepharisma stoltei]|uniref:VWFA domain-containing protein n=1 Tax=Blepharisma stoltei TaxID=1481888 RepID=A0AAU9IS48_9CILI|nr:unnamed protein product [Blepharisma stoltei]